MKYKVDITFISSVSGKENTTGTIILADTEEDVFENAKKHAKKWKRCKEVVKVVIHFCYPS